MKVRNETKGRTLRKFGEERTVRNMDKKKLSVMRKNRGLWIQPLQRAVHLFSSSQNATF